jgi:deoxyadenosine/deoxycytidine kinase
MFKLMESDVASPEVTAILNPNREKIQGQIKARGRSYEQNMPEEYLDKIALHYKQYYRYARGSRILWIDTSSLDFVSNPSDAQRLIELILTPRKAGVYELTP